MEARVGRITVSVVKGDITKIRADALVNPANSMLIMGGGVAGALKRAAGEEVEREALNKAPVPVGEAASTSAGRLSARYIIHAPTMERPAMRIGSENVYKATLAALREAERLGVESVAFPGMGTGVGGVNPDDAAEAMIRAIKQVASSDGRPLKVILVAYDDELYQVFTRAVSRIF